MGKLGRRIMGSYSPLRITGPHTGLIQEREEFLLPNDAYPVLQNAYVWRERILRKKGFELLGRLQKTIGTTDAGGNAVINITPLPIQPGVAYFVIGSDIFQDPGGANPVNLLTNIAGVGPFGVLNRATGVLTITGSQPLTDIQYYPGLPVMGIRTRELSPAINDQTLFFDQNYAYFFNGVTSQFEEFIPGTTWNAHAASVSGVDFFWSTNYWGSSLTDFTTENRKLFWVTNNTGAFGALADPPRITDGVTWVDFFPSAWSQIDATNFLTNWLCMLPFRGRMVVFNTWEGASAAGSLQYSNRIRWSTIGNPFISYAAGPPATGSWRDDIRGQGGFLDIPTSEDIVSIGFVRDNLVIYCERSTWQLRYTGRSIAPFQIERVNSELGTEGTFSSVQFDTSLVGVGDKGLVECDSYKSERIDIKIPDFVYKFNSLNDGPLRVQGVRDFINRLAFWTTPLTSFYDGEVDSASWIFPNIRLLYNYENDSWATFNDSLTALGTYQPPSNRTWLNTPIPWIECLFTWISDDKADPKIVGGNQQGFVEILDQLSVNDVSLFISNLTQGDTVTVTSPNHNMQTDFVIEITSIPLTSPFSSLNDSVFGIVVTGANTFEIYSYDTSEDAFQTEVIATPSGTYTGGGLIKIRENFYIKSKKFNFIDDGQNIQMGYLDILLAASNGEISLNVYLDYDDSTVSNKYPENTINNNPFTKTPDTFFNSVIPTSKPDLSQIEGSKFWQRVYCATRANFLTLEYTFSNLQMSNLQQTKGVQIDAQTLWLRKAGRMTSI